MHLMRNDFYILFEDNTPRKMLKARRNRLVDNKTEDENRTDGESKTEGRNETEEENITESGHQMGETQTEGKNQCESEKTQNNKSSESLKLLEGSEITVQNDNTKENIKSHGLEADPIQKKPEPKFSSVLACISRGG